MSNSKNDEKLLGKRERSSSFRKFEGEVVIDDHAGSSSSPSGELVPDMPCA